MRISDWSSDVCSSDPPGELVARDPVRGRLPALEQARLAEHQRTQAQADDQLAAGVGAPQRLHEFGRDGLMGVVPGGHDDDVGLMQSVQAIGHRSAERRVGYVYVLTC